ncbi:zona pellucida-like domain-containing protein 1 [Electrophorus electricus]|uniref:zona pellucida-like domain-containing protein 1 n=1 Tax=Electrophorus electricus TaxID=8005 RepID=UPI0015D078D1|nr:zona pellucida-like domain-containing protein 1 [Electrophorus electricus]
MWLLLLLYQLGLLLHGQAQNPCNTHPTFRKQAHSDITVTCGTETLELRVLMCPVYFGGYNESMLVLNGVQDKPECTGTPDWTSDPPILLFRFSITHQGVSACSNKIKTTQEVGTGVFADYSSVQFVNISGTINSVDPLAQIITYQSSLLYLFSCRYPLQYLMNDTETRVSGGNIAIKDNNGSFVSALNMQLYQDQKFTIQLQIPPTGLTLKTRIFVKVRAKNLTSRLNVLLDRCYVTTSSSFMDRTFYDLFIGCNCNGRTVIGVNGDAQEACFSFEAFRFKEHQNQSVSTFYLHCTSRLCDRTVCSSLHQNCTQAARKKREDQGTAVSDRATVSSGPIITRVDSSDNGVTNKLQNNEAVLTVSLAAGLLGVFCIALPALFFHSGKFTDSQKLLNAS